MRKTVVPKSTLGLVRLGASGVRAFVWLCVLRMQDHVCCENLLLHEPFATFHAWVRMGVVAVQDLVHMEASGVEVTLVTTGETANERALSVVVALHVHLEVLPAFEVFLTALVGALVRSIRFMHVLV